MATNWKELSGGMKQEPAVFVAGVPRGGVRLLRRTLARLPAFAAEKARGSQTSLFVAPERVLSILEPAGGELLRYLTGDEAAAGRVLEAARRAMRSFPAHNRAFARLWSLCSRSESSRVRIWRMRGHHHLVRVYFHFAKRVRAVGRVLEKTSAHLHYLPELWTTFPEARVVLCVRHPVSTFASYRGPVLKGVRKGEEAGAGWLRSHPEEFTRSYAADAARIGAALATDQRRIGLVRYEELTRKPAVVLERLCDFLGEPFDEMVLLGAVEERFDKDGIPRSNCRVAPNPKRWRDFLYEDEARLIEERLGSEMKQFGYESLLDV